MEGDGEALVIQTGEDPGAKLWRQPLHPHFLHSSTAARGRGLAGEISCCCWLCLWCGLVLLTSAPADGRCRSLPLEILHHRGAVCPNSRVLLLLIHLAVLRSGAICHGVVGKPQCYPRGSYTECYEQGG